jgi:dynein intermediate chain
MGTEEGTVFQANRFDRAGTKSGVEKGMLGHSGPVTAIQFHPELSQMFLTSSIDWTIKLWKTVNYFPNFRIHLQLRFYIQLNHKIM